MSKLDTSTSLPASWNFVPLKELGDWSGGGTPSKAKPQYWQGGTIPWVSPKDMKAERISDSEDHITKEAVSHSTASLINADSVLIVTRSGILRHTLPVAVNSVPVTVNQDLKALTPRNGIMAEYVAWALRAFSRDILHTCSKQGTTVNSVETSKLLGFEIPVAPRGQQAKIVAEIEKQFSRLDEAVANLKRVKANLKRYKASVLKAAVEGKLTEDWRKQHPNVEPASKLLERILAERRAKWSGKRQFIEPSAPETTDLPALQKGWTYASVEQLGIIGEQAVLTGPFGTNLGREDFRETGVPVLTISCLKETGIDLTKAGFVSKEKARELNRYQLKNGDLLFSRMAAVGRAGIVGESLRGSLFNYHIMRLRLEPTVLMAKYYLAYVRGSAQVENYIREVNHGATRDGINTEQLLNMPVALPPFAEQQCIVAEVERRLSVIEELEAAVQANLTRADRLRQSILSQAFSGMLVKPNPTRMMKGY